MIGPADWTEADGLALEPNARRAVMMEEGSSVIIAGPGAGKTEMLAQRADFLLRTGLCRYPHRILAISFKADAARTLGARVRKRSGFERASRLDSITFHAFARRIIELFRPILKAGDALDSGFSVGPKRIGRKQVAFEELLPLALKIIDVEPMVARAIRMTYTHVFLDEFQDCTDRQYALIKALFSEADIGLTAVGDTKQRIMVWAGALDGVFEKFLGDFGAVSLNLFQNYRSKMRLRRVQNTMVRVMDQNAALDDDALVGEEGTVEVLSSATCGEEAELIAGRISQWMEDGIPAEQIAVLVPREPAFLCQPLASALDERGIPFRNEQDLQDLSMEPVAELVIHFLRSIADKPAPDAYAALMHAVSDPFDEDDGAPGWVRFLEQHRIALRTAERSRRGAAMRNAVDAFVKRFSSAHLLALSSDYGDTAYVDSIVSTVCDHLEVLVDETGDLAVALSRFAAEGTVRIMTIHKCKGMEFDAVIMPGTETQTWWAKRGEERNAFFVGVSRAKSHLLVTHADRREKPAGYPRQWKVSRDADEEFLEYVLAEAGEGLPRET